MSGDPLEMVFVSRGLGTGFVATPTVRSLEPDLSLEALGGGGGKDKDAVGGGGKDKEGMLRLVDKPEDGSG